MATSHTFFVQSKLNDKNIFPTDFNYNYQFFV